MSQPSVSIHCPSCETPLATTLALAGGGDPEETDELRGKELRCRTCDTELELLFYPPSPERREVATDGHAR